MASQSPVHRRLARYVRQTHDVRAAAMQCSLQMMEMFFEAEAAATVLAFHLV